MFKRKTGKSKAKVVKSKKVINAEINAEPEKCFWLCDGQILKNLKELAKALDKMSNEVFSYHVNKNKNDFAKWVEDVFGERKLAIDLKKAKTPKTAAKKIKIKIK